MFFNNIYTVFINKFDNKHRYCTFTILELYDKIWFKCTSFNNKYFETHQLFLHSNKLQLVQYLFGQIVEALKRKMAELAERVKRKLNKRSDSNSELALVYCSATLECGLSLSNSKWDGNSI